MKKFVFLYVGYEEPTDQVKEAWMNWFGSISESIVDSGNPLGAGREVTPNGTTDLPLGKDSITGYTIIRADSLDEAERIAQECPIVASTRVYEMRSE